MASLLDMSMDPEEAKEQMSLAEKDEPRYPWGLCLTLNDDVLEKLGLLKPLPAVGDEVLITALATVTGVRSNSVRSGENESSVDLQITNMDVDNAPEDMSQQASKLYGGGG